MEHKLKIEPRYFMEVYEKRKTFEIRKNDRDFKVGDTLILQEYMKEHRQYTGNVLRRKITYITDYAQQDDYIVMAII